MTEQQSFVDKVLARWDDYDSRVCVGLDPDPSKFPVKVNNVVEFCKSVVDATADYVCAYKPQFAHFAALGMENELSELIEWIHVEHNEIPVILDAKRGDIGSTADLYAREVFERYCADAVTLNPYLGIESIEPYLQFPNKGIFLLCRTSNQGSDWLQNYPEDSPTFLRIAKKAAELSEVNNVMLVVGGTYPADLERVRQVVGEMIILVPGIGAQGGDLAKVLRSGGTRLIVNSSRQIIYSGSGLNYQEDIRKAAKRFRDDIRAGIAAL